MPEDLKTEYDKEQDGFYTIPNADFTAAVIDGLFTPNDLRRIADLLDKYKVKAEQI